MKGYYNVCLTDNTTCTMNKCFDQFSENSHNSLLIKLQHLPKAGNACIPDLRNESSVKWFLVKFMLIALILLKGGSQNYLVMYVRGRWLLDKCIDTAATV